ncbi:hypothetical protein COMNV_01618 [Commensalibacter sp. Nvir]|uniref:rod shape-determining protein MreC n=1 Tax=Commensalibacter sp. Nvir TaxID=3069817 RepID=UPI002D3C0125|nr:hypothetical protein COMNV_01618 [Commensalibacter sp. Nvir]
MIPLSIHIKQGLAKLILPALYLVTLLIMLLGQTQPRIIEVIRSKVMDFLAPGYALVETPFNSIHGMVENFIDVRDLAFKNNQLKEENDRLKRWYYVAMGLAEENAMFKKQLHWIPDPIPSFVTARVVADVSGVYHKAMLVFLDSIHQVSVGDVALSGFGFVGRVTEVGERSARILLINDDASKIPVFLNSSQAQAIMEGDNSTYPKLIYFPEDKHPVEGERVTTDNKGNALPAGIPIGYVHYLKRDTAVVIPYTLLNQLRIVRIFNYGNSNPVIPKALGRLEKPVKKFKRNFVASPHLVKRNHND